jgi:hypothetical protein
VNPSRGRWEFRTAADGDDGRLRGNVGYLVKTFVAERPLLSLVTGRVRRPALALRGDTDVVIEGYPKSANSFVAHAFAMVQPRPIRVSHHIHAPGQVVVAARRRLPVLVLVRSPVDAAARVAVVRPAVSLRLLLRGWVRFYAPLLRWRRSFVVGRFDEVTSDLGSVIVRMNERFGTRFVPFEHTSDNLAATFRALEDDWASRIAPDDPAFEFHVNRPSAARAALTEELAERLRGPRYASLRARAEDLFDRITAS